MRVLPFVPPGDRFAAGARSFPFSPSLRVLLCRHERSPSACLEVLLWPLCRCRLRLSILFVSVCAAVAPVPTPDHEADNPQVVPPQPPNTTVA